MPANDKIRKRSDWMRTEDIKPIKVGRTEDAETCDAIEVHSDLLKIVNTTLPEETELYDLAELFKVFGDSTRIRILFVLFEAEVCVCDLAAALNMTQSAISHQLKILKQSKLVKSMKRRQISVLFSCGWSCENNNCTGKRTYRRRFIKTKVKIKIIIKTAYQFTSVSDTPFLSWR